MRSISILFFLFLITNSCNAQKKYVGRVFEYTYEDRPTVLDNGIYFKTDSTLVVTGGDGQYAYSWFPNYKILNDSTYFVYHTNPRTAKYPISDTIMIRVMMNDVKNDTIYWKNDKEFIFRERLFKLFEYKGVPLEDQ